MSKPVSILVHIRRMGRGFVACSDDLKGFRVFHSSLSEVVAEIPDVIKAMYRAKGQVVSVQDESSEDGKDVFPLRYTAKAA